MTAGGSETKALALRSWGFCRIWHTLILVSMALAELATEANMNDFGVIKTTTDKLQEELNRLAEFKAEVVQTQYVGGRDWVIIHGQSEMDPWHSKNWEAGHSGLFQPWMCGIGSTETPGVVCVYQRNHSGRCHWMPSDANDSLLYATQDDDRQDSPPEEPLLGLASTRELLQEVATRMRITQNSNAGRDLGRECELAIDNLDSGVLDYNTVHPSGNDFVIAQNAHTANHTTTKFKIGN